MYTTAMKYQPRKLLLLTLGWLIVLIATVVLLASNPECPEYYTQAQVDAEGCVVGANIGAGLLAQFVLLPLTVLVLIGWGSRLFNKKTKPPKKH